jgi:hypothetical protein
MAPPPVATSMPPPFGYDANELRRDPPKRDEREGARPSDRTAEAMRHIETAVRQIETVTTPAPVAHSYPPPAATAASEAWRNVPKRDERDAGRPADRPFDAVRHIEMPPAPTSAVQAYRPSDRSAESVDLEMTPLAQSFLRRRRPPRAASGGPRRRPRTPRSLVRPTPYVPSRHRRRRQRPTTRRHRSAARSHFLM